MRELFEKFKKLLPIITITLIILTFYFVFILGDPILPESQATAISANFIGIAKLVLIRFFLYAIFPIILCTSLLFKIPKNKLWFVLLLLLMLIFYLP